VYLGPQIHPGHAVLEKRRPALIDSLLQVRYEASAPHGVCIRSSHRCTSSIALRLITALGPPHAAPSWQPRHCPDLLRAGGNTVC